VVVKQQTKRNKMLQQIVRKDAVIDRLSQASQILVEAKSMQEVKKIMDVADAARIYAKRQQLGDEAVSYANSIKIEAMRRLGKLWKNAPKNKGTQATSQLGGYQENPPSSLADLGISKKQAHTIRRLEEMPDNEFEQVKEGVIGMAEALRQVKKEKIIRDLESIKNKKSKKLLGQYDVIVIDPPWPMEKISRDVRPNQTNFDYPTMTEEEILKVEIPSANDCHLWMWTTQKFLTMAFRVLKAWSFNYVCTFVWHKPGGFQPIGLPQYNCEFALYARKGAPKFIDTKAFPTCFSAPRGAHSQKPEEFYDMVRRVTAGRRLDMFNRRKITGFETWGNQAA
jgi:N6-adenosine-specific RNA methylase IME4